MKVSLDYNIPEPEKVDGGRFSLNEKIMKYLMNNCTIDRKSNQYLKDKSVINSKKCKVAIKKSERIIKNYGRMLVRKSGTEPKIRIMGESNNIHLLKRCINIVKRSIK